MHYLCLPGEISITHALNFKYISKTFTEPTSWFNDTDLWNYPTPTGHMIKLAIDFAKFANVF